MCCFIAQLVEHRTGIRWGHGFESRWGIDFVRLLLSNCLNWKNLLRWLPFIYHRSSHMNYFIYTSRQGLRRSLMWLGACLLSALNVIERILNLIRCSIGSQWRSLRRGVMWSYLLDLNTILTAQFNTRWSRCNKYLGTPYSNELQPLTFDIMKACTRDLVVSINIFR